MKKDEAMDKNPFDDLVDYLFLSANRIEFRLLSDKQLLRHYADNGDELAFGEVVRRHGAMVWTICRRNLRQRQVAKDVYQVIFLKLVRQATFVQQYESAASWLHRVAHNAAIDAKLMIDRQHAREERRATMYEDGFTDPRDTKNLACLLNKEVGYLPEKCRSPIILCYLEGLTCEQAARRIKISTPCLKRRLAEGRQRLHRRLSKRGINLDSTMLMAGLTANLHSHQVPPGLMEKTLHMVRIMTQSNSASDPPPNNGSVMMLAKSALETWTFKAKLLLALMLVTLLLVGGSLIAYSGWWSIRGEQHQKNMPAPANKVKPKPEIHEIPLQHRHDNSLS